MSRRDGEDSETRGAVARRDRVRRHDGRHDAADAALRLLPTALGFSNLTSTVIFAAYAVGVLAALLVLGRASDAIGRRLTLFAGLMCAAASAVVFLRCARPEHC